MRPVPRSAAGARSRRGFVALLAFASGALFFERLSGQTFFDPDGFHEMALFREWLRTGSLPLRDPFAFTSTIVPAVHHEWGAGAILYVLAMGPGAPGVVAARWLLSLAVALVAVRTAARRAPAVVVAFSAPAAILLSQPAFTTIRAGLYTMLFLAIVLALLERDRQAPRPVRFLAIYLPVLAIWINLHAGWVVGVAAVGLHAAEQALRRRPLRHLAVALGATPLLMLATPYGRAYFPGWWRSISFHREAIGEWASLGQSHYALGLGAFGVAMLLVTYAVARLGPGTLRRLAAPESPVPSPGSPDLGGLLFVLASSWAAWRHERHVALFALAWFCAVPGYLAATPLGELLEAGAARRAIRWTIGVPAIGAGVALLALALAQHPFALRVPANGSDLGPSPVVYPAGAVEYLRQAGFRGRLGTSFVNGGFVIWKLFPPVQVSFDGRYEVAYPAEALDEDRAIHGARPGWQRIVGRYGPDAILVRRDEPLASALPGGTAFGRVYRDDAYEVWAPPASGLPPVDRRVALIPAAFP